METAEDALACEDTACSEPSVNDASNLSLSPLNRSVSARSPKSDRKRKVSFPDDHALPLFHSQEPKDPWQDGGKATSSEVIESYRTACNISKTKPCDKLIKQLEACESFHERIDVIDLRGTKLDQKSCESLEEVFRQVRTRTLDLENTNLDDEGVISLLEMVEFYHTANRINLAYNNKIKIRGWQAIARAVKLTPCLEYLDLRHTVWTEQSIPLLGRSLKLGCNLVVLHMEATNLTGKPLFLLATAVKTNHNLRDLFLGDNRLVPSDGQCLGTMLKSNKTLRLLDLRNNQLQDMGLAHLCEGLVEQRDGGLQTLVLWNNQLTFQGMSALANALVALTSLQTLNLGHNRLTNEGIHLLKSGLLGNKSLQRVGLLNTRLSSEGIIALAEVVADSKTLLRLDLRENDPYVGGLMALALSLKVNNSLVRIDLDKELKKEPGMETTQRILLADIYGYCQRNKSLAKDQESDPAPGASSPTTSQSSVSEPTPASKPKSSGTSLLSFPSTNSSPKPVIRNLVRDFFPRVSRFTITRIMEDTSTSNEASASPGTDPLLANVGCTPPNWTSSNPGAVPGVTEQLSDIKLVDIDSDTSASSQPSSDVKLLDIDSDTSGSPTRLSDVNLLDIDSNASGSPTRLSDVNLLDIDSDASGSPERVEPFVFDNDHFAIGRRESLDSLGTPISRDCDDDTASYEEHSAHPFERELDEMLASVTSSQHTCVTSNATDATSHVAEFTNHTEDVCDQSTSDCDVDNSSHTTEVTNCVTDVTSHAISEANHVSAVTINATDVTGNTIDVTKNSLDDGFWKEQLDGLRKNANVNSSPPSSGDLLFCE
ncbi:protein phosphatase 1 regulatory subunit 37 [Nematostella vectensis]|uniref:protein phosphatase 1 regulatory subunit 37 n=1 Tax=Nematostella vectensis TaxID=45351 RepID=UPI0020776C57|nr:protein phosphatase 1 regulatory subunit 37 [Nematostella vectensis]